MAFLTVQRRPQAPARRVRNDALVSFNHIHPSPELAQLTRNHIAGNLRTRQQDSLPSYLSPQAGHYGFGDVLLRHDTHLEAMIFDGPPGGWADRGNLKVRQMSCVKPELS